MEILTEMWADKSKLVAVILAVICVFSLAILG